ncbi:MAG TPA: prolyl oligopeptidase family serine peptidase, partial [Cyclobacteriaceae bacterium]|nr:prolyl oligopeptidase family serine peptidase [Cyclobacteriaceae bacterium]
MKLTAIVLLVFSASVAVAQPARIHKEYRQANFKGIRYGLFVPSGQVPGKLYPLVLYLHGSGDTVSRDNYWYKESIQKENPLFVVTPKCLNGNQGWGNTWSAQHSPEMSKSLALVDSLVRKYPIDPNRLYIYGISMGGFGVFSVLQKNPGKFAAAYAICGGSDPAAAA